MSTLREAAYNILNSLRGGRTTNNEHVSIRQIQYTLLYYRSTLIRRDIERGRKVRGYEQSIYPVNMNLDLNVDKQEIWTTLKSEKPIPNRVRLQSRNPISFVGTDSTSSSFQVVNYNQVRHLTHRKYTSDKAYAYELDDYLYIWGDSTSRKIKSILSESESSLKGSRISQVKIRGIFENPYEAANYNSDIYLTDNDECPAFPLDLVQRITQSILNGEARILTTSPNDEILDNLPDSQ